MKTDKLSQAGLILQVGPTWFRYYRFNPWETILTMPLYDFKCKCGYTGEHITKIDEKLKCPDCGLVLRRVLPCTHSINMGAGAYGYFDDNLQTYIHSNRHKKQVMKEQGVSEAFGKGWY